MFGVCGVEKEASRQKGEESVKLSTLILNFSSESKLDPPDLGELTDKDLFSKAITVSPTASKVSSTSAN